MLSAFVMFDYWSGVVGVEINVNGYLVIFTKWFKGIVRWITGNVKEITYFQFWILVTWNLLKFSYVFSKFLVYTNLLACGLLLYFEYLIYKYQ